MPKTKKSSLARARRSKTSVVKTIVQEEVKKTSCQSSCWLCWLFKLMIALFVIMIIFWLGFCFGALSSYMPKRTITYSPRMSVSQNGFCMPTMERLISNMNANLENKTGDNFDKEFLLQMSIHHEGAIEMAEKALESSARPEIKEMAQGIIDSQNKEIETMKSWLTDWFVK